MNLIHTSTDNYFNYQSIFQYLDQFSVWFIKCQNDERPAQFPQSPKLRYKSVYRNIKTEKHQNETREFGGY